MLAGPCLYNALICRISQARDCERPAFPSERWFELVPPEFAAESSKELRSIPTCAMICRDWLQCCRSPPGAYFADVLAGHAGHSLG